MKKSIICLLCAIFCWISLEISMFFNFFFAIAISFIGIVFYGFWAIYEFRKESKGDSISEIKST